MTVVTDPKIVITSRPGGDNDFRISDYSQFSDLRRQATGIFTALIAGIAGISLIVGGIGVMNIMLVSVTERTREIGLRKALGATHKAIMSQFIVEAVLLCVIGGLVGVFLGTSTLYLIASFQEWPFAMPFSAIVGSITFSAEKVMEPTIALNGIAKGHS